MSERSKPMAYDITTWGGKERVKGRVLGLFGVHKVNGSCTITHIPTGYAALSGIPERDAIKTLRVFHEAPCNWNFDDVKKVPRKTRAWGKKFAAEFYAKQGLGVK
jgi:hypothetical protein